MFPPTLSTNMVYSGLVPTLLTPQRQNVSGTAEETASQISQSGNPNGYITPSITQKPKLYTFQFRDISSNWNSPTQSRRMSRIDTVTAPSSSWQIEHGFTQRFQPVKYEELLTPTKKKDVSAANFGNDYSTYFVKQRRVPQTWIRNIEDPLDGYPKLQLLHEMKKEHYFKHAKPAVGIKCPSSKLSASIQNMHKQGVLFDVVVVNGCVSQFSFEELKSLHIELITPRPSLLYLWVPTSKIAEGRELMNSWGFRRGEDITYMVNSLESVHAPQTSPWSDDVPLFVPTTWHCLMGLKGTIRRSSDTKLINCNIDTDVIIEKRSEHKGIVPKEFYQLVENFTSMERKLHICPTETPESLPVRPRPGWVMMGPSSFSFGKFEPSVYRHRSLIPVKEEIDTLRPQTPPSSKR